MKEFYVEENLLYKGIKIRCMFILDDMFERMFSCNMKL